MKLYVMEAIGTFFLVLAVGLGEPLSIGMMLMAMVYLGGHISGAHYNPAVTLSVFLRGSMSKVLVPGYIIAQVCGATVALGLTFYLNGALPGPMPDINFTLWEVALIEALLTAVLCWIVLTVSTSAKFRGHAIYGVVIGLTLFAIVMMGRNITGGIFNPALTFSSAILNMFVRRGGLTISVLFAYLIGQFVGGYAAVHAFKYLNSDER